MARSATEKGLMRTKGRGQTEAGSGVVLNSLHQPSLHFPPPHTHTRNCCRQSSPLKEDRHRSMGAAAGGCGRRVGCRTPCEQAFKEATPECGRALVCLGLPPAITRTQSLPLKGQRQGTTMAFVLFWRVVGGGVQCPSWKQGLPSDPLERFWSDGLEDS